MAFPSGQATQTTSNAVAPSAPAEIYGDAEPSVCTSSNYHDASIEHHPKDMPEHWKSKPSHKNKPSLLLNFLSFLFTFLCMVGFGHRNLNFKWNVISSGVEENFKKEEDRIRNMLGNSILVVRSRLCTTP
jgi:hypothetical protein